MTLTSLPRGRMAKSPLCLRTTIHRTSRANDAQVRTLWWWGRGGKSASIDEELEERIRRHQRIMKFRYSKALRRRALWEREHHLYRSKPWHETDRWLGSTYCSSKSISSDTGPERDPGQKEQDNFNGKFQKFKAAIDRSVAEDPYGTIFGRRLQGPPSSNNSSWTSFAWIFDTTSVRGRDRTNTEPKTPSEQPSQQQDPPPPSNSDTVTAPQQMRTTTSPPAGEEYEYDPISGRKVPVIKESAPKPAPAKPFLETLFSENGVDIPVKTYKPHKVFGFGANESMSPTMQTDKVPMPGNSIDTTMLFTEPEFAEAREKRTAEQNETENAPRKRLREAPEPEDATPLFTGTTYQDRSAELVERQASQSAWLEKEGFLSERETPLADSPGSAPMTNVPGPKSSGKLQPAVDRIQQQARKEAETDRIKRETSLDRQASVLNDSKNFVEAPREDTQEDIDLLRASDIRAATRTARKTRAEVENDNREVRLKLEADSAEKAKSYPSADDESAAEATEAKEKVTKSLTNVWSHIRNYPSGIVAKTMQSISNSNYPWKNYVRPEGKKDLTEKLKFEDESLSKTPSIYRTRPKSKAAPPLDSSQEVLTAQNENAERTLALKRATDEAREKAEAEKEEASRLASIIKDAYEDTYGAIDENHRQPSPESAHTKPATALRDDINVKFLVSKAHPLSVASMKAGVQTDPIIANHIGNFEPRFAELVDKAKVVNSELKAAEDEIKTIRPSKTASTLEDVIDRTREVRRELHEAQQTLRAIEGKRPETIWNSSAATPDFGDKRIDVKAQDQPAQTPTAADDAVAKKYSPAIPAISDDTVAKKYIPSVPEPFITPDGSPEWNDEQPPPIESLQKALFTSEYVVLTLDPSNGEVNLSPMNGVATRADKPNPLVNIMARVKQASKFVKYFAPLEAAGYELYQGGGTVMIFKKKPSGSAANIAAVDDAEGPKPDSAASLVTRQSAQGTPMLKDEATVLDDIPVEIEAPGPAAPTAPPPAPFKQPSDVTPARVSRQEAVFSGIRPSATPTSSTATSSDTKSEAESSSLPPPKSNIFSRLGQFVRRTVLTIAALSGAAYAIGVVAEGMGAQSQVQKNVEGAAGPRKRIVMPTGQRPGIFSTESSR